MLTPFTGGGSAAAGAGILAALGGALTSGTVAAAAAIAAATATIVTKQVMLGDAYSGEDMAIDVVVGAVDALAAYATAGIGAGLLKAARGGRLAQMAAGPSRLARVGAHALAEGAEGLIGSLPAAVASNVSNDQNWEHGNPLVNIMGGIAIEAGIGTIVSAGMGGLSGIRQAPAPTARPSADLYANRGTPQDRLAQWRAHKADNPGADMRTWLRDFDAGVSDHLAAQELSHQSQRRLRRDLLSGIPESQRRRFANANIEVLSDVEFTRRAGSRSGSAVTIIEGGKPRVFLREGADPRSLREEGLHMLQSIDPRTRRAVRSLDERNLQNWDNLSIDDQMRLYRNKVELEIDAQNRLLRSLDDELADTGSNRASRRALQAQRDLADQNLSNLQQRLGDVERVTPRKRRSMARGLESRPDYLAQPPRLFSKGGDIKTRSALYDALGSDQQVAQAREALTLLNSRARNNPGLKKVNDSIIASAERISRTDPVAASRYLEAVQEVLQASPRRANTKRVLPFLRFASKLSEPDVFLRNVRDFISDPRIRGDMLEGFGDRIGKMTRQDASDFMVRLRTLTAVDPADATLLQQAADALRAFARSRRSVRLGLVNDIVTELTRKRRFDWNVFRQTLGTKYPNSTGFIALEDILTNRQLTASWDAADIGAVRHWATALRELHDALPVKQQTRLMQEFSDLLDGFASGYSSGSYRKMRHLIRRRVIDHVLTTSSGRARSASTRMSTLRNFLDTFQNIDSASKGALFTEFREGLLQKGHRMAGDFSSVETIPRAPLKMPNDKTADGALSVGSSMGSGKPRRGRYLLDDKAGAAPF